MQKTHTHSKPQRSTSGVVMRAVKVAVAVLAVGAALLGAKSLFSNPALIQALLDGARQHPGTAIPLFFVVNVLAPLALLPPSPFLLLAGAIWGLWKGMAISGTATLLSNLAAFWLGRRLLRARISAYITANVTSFPAIQKAILAEGWSLVLMLRLAPILPDSVMNYLLAITDVSPAVYVAATTVATLCWSGLSLYIGSASTDIVATLTGSGSVAGQGASAPSAGEEVNMLAVGVSVVLAVGAVLYMGRVIQKAIKAAAEQEHKAE